MGSLGMAIASQAGVTGGAKGGEAVCWGFQRSVPSGLPAECCLLSAAATAAAAAGAVAATAATAAATAAAAAAGHGTVGFTFARPVFSLKPHRLQTARIWAPQGAAR